MATRSTSTVNAESSTTSASTAVITTMAFFGEQMGGQRAAIDITLEAVKEFQVVASGASAEFGRTGGGIVNVITKSGTNQVRGSLFHYQRVAALTSNTSDGNPLDKFHREQ